MLTRVMFALGGLLLLSVLPSRAQDPPAPKQSFTLPYTTWGTSSIPIVQIAFSDGKLRPAGFDTGADFNVISDTLAKELGVPRKPYITSTGITGKPLDGARLNFTYSTGVLNYVFFIFDDKDIPAIGGRPLHAFIGNNLLDSGFACLVDPEKKEITLFIGSGFDAEELKRLGLEGAEVVPRVVSDSKSFDIRVKINDKFDTVLPLDTGSDFFTLSQADVKRMKLKPTGKTEEGYTLAGATRKVYVNVKKMSIGSLSFTEVEAVYRGKESSFVPFGIGMNFLSKFRFLIDYTAGKLYLKPLPEPTSKPAGAKETP
jgi:predicted aspartyl protease